MGTEQDEYYMMGDRPGRKPSLQARLQSGIYIITLSLSYYTWPNIRNN